MIVPKPALLLAGATLGILLLAAGWALPAQPMSAQTPACSVFGSCAGEMSPPLGCSPWDPRCTAQSPAPFGAGSTLEACSPLDPRCGASAPALFGEGCSPWDPRCATSAPPLFGAGCSPWDPRCATAPASTAGLGCSIFDPRGC